MKAKIVITGAMFLFALTCFADPDDIPEDGWFRTMSVEEFSLPEGVVPDVIESASELGTAQQRSFTNASGYAEEITPAIQALADGLGRDPVRIYNYVHDHIRYVLYFGSKKGAQLTLLERSGNDFDQSALLVALLRAAGYQNASSQFGWMRIPYENPNGSHRDLRHWLGLTFPNTNWNYTFEYLRNLYTGMRGYPLLYNTDIDSNSVYVQRVWVQLPLNGSNCQLDPAFKISEPIGGLSITSAMGFSSNGVMTAAAGVDTGTYVTNLNEAALRGILAGYSETLSSYLQSNCPNASVANVLSGYRIVPSTNTGFSSVYTFPVVSWNYPGSMVMQLVNWPNQPTNLMARLKITAAGTNYEWLVPELKGERIDLTFSTTGTAALWHNDVKLLEKSTTGTSRFTNVILSIDQPFGKWDTTNNTLIPNTKSDRTVTNAYQRTNSSYALIYAFEPDWNWLEDRQKKLADYRAQGIAESSREVVGETLNAMGLNWMLQSEWVGRLMASQMGMLSQQHHRFGRMAQELGRGYYVDVYMQNSGDAAATIRDVATTDAEIRYFDLLSYFQSALEHGIMEQFQDSGLVGASTVKMLQLANTNGQAVYLASSANWTSGANVRSKLVNYSLSSLDSFINAGYYLFLPRNGSNLVNGAGSWGGTAYVARKLTATNIDVRMYIGGGYNGGYISDPSVTINPTLVDEFGSSRPDYFNAGPPTTPTVFGADPVNMADGSFQLNATDLTVGQAEPRGFSFNRHYNPARRNYNSDGLGYGWVHNYHFMADEVAAPKAGLGATTPAQMVPMIVATVSAIGIYNDSQPNPKNWLVSALIAKWGIDQLTKNGASILMGKDTIQFVRQPDGTFTPPAGITMTLLKTNSAYQLQARHGNAFKFNTAGYLTNIVDQYGQSLTVAYNASNWVSQLQDWKNRTLTLNYGGTPQRLTSITDSAGRSVYYGYNGQGDLNSVTDPESKNSTLIYDTNHQIIATINALNQTVTSNRYDGFGRVIEQYSQGLTNQTWSFLWSDFENIEIDPTGARRTFYYDDQRRLTGSRDALSNLSQTFYDGQDHVVMTVSPLNNTNRFIFDGHHNVILAIDPLGNTNQFGYDGQFNLTRSVDKRGNPSSFGYNSKFQLTGTTNGAGDWLNMTYNPGDGTLATRADSAGTTIYGYDSYGLLNSITYPDSLGSESFVNNALGDRSSHIDARNFPFSYQYNLRRELTNTVMPANLTNSVAYDAVGNVQSTTDARGFKRSNCWSATQKLLSMTLPVTPQGTPVITNSYDTRDWQARTWDPIQASTSFTNDTAGRLVGQTDPLSRTTRFVYDADGRITTTTNAALEVTSRAWTARGESTRVTDGTNRTVLRFYDAAGNQVTLTNRNGKKWQFQYDSANRLTNTVTPLNRKTSQAYNDRGLLESVKEPSTQSTTFDYDAKGRLRTRSDPVASITYQYDANDNVTNIIENGLTNSWACDAHDRATEYRDADGDLIQYRYDQNGNLTNLIYPGNRTVVYAYDSLNRLTNVMDWNNRKTSLEYDLASRLKKVTRPNGTVREIGYDVAGQMTNITERLTNNYPIAFFRFNWNSAARMDWEFSAPLPHTNALPARTMTFDDDNRLATFNGQTIVHDSDGNMTSGPLTNSALVSYGYNARNQLLSVGGVSYGYDPQGNRTALTNGANTVKFVVNPNAALSQVLMRVRSGVTNYYIYGPGLLYEITETATSTNTLTYHYDYRGSTMALTADNGMPTDRMEYSAYGSLTYRIGTNDTPFLFNGRYGVQTDADGLLYMRARYYTPLLGRFINADPSGFSSGLNFYAYADGNPISLIDPFGLGAVDDNCGTSWLHSQLVLNAVGMLASMIGLERTQPMPDYIDAYISEFFGTSPPSPRPPSALDRYMEEAMASLTPEDHMFLMTLGTSRAPSASGPGGLGSLTPAQVRQIQAFSERFGAEVNVVGSRAAGTAGQFSDFDYVIGGNASLRHSAERFLPRNPQSVMGTEAGNLPFQGIDIFNANKTPLDPTRPFIQFTPGQAAVVGP